VNNTYSQWKPVISGVPQGTVLGPLLFTIFVSDMPEEMSNFIALFADDTKIYSYLLEDGQGHLSSNLQEDLNNLQAWATTMQMKFHPDKCKCMHLGKLNPKKNYSMSTQDGTTHTLAATSLEKDLGVWIDDELSFSQHIQTKISKANQVLGMLRHTFKFMEPTSFTLLYKSLIRPHLEYAMVVWAPHTKRLKDSLEQVQRRATRMVAGMSDLSYPERLRKLNLPTLEFRRQRADQIQLYKLTHHIDTINTSKPCPVCNNTMLKPTLSTKTRGHQHKYQIQTTSGIRRHFLTTRALNAWNRLEEETVSSPTIDSFKRRLAKEWRSHPDQYVYHFSY